MRLAVLPGLDAILGQAQEPVGGGQLGHGIGREQPLGTEQRKHRLDRAYLQVRIAAAANELKRLADELDLANTARAELDVVGHALALEFAVDQGLEVAQGFDSAEVQIAPVNKGPQHGHQLGDGAGLAGHGPRLGHGVALPLPRLGVVIAFHGVEAHGQRTGGAERP